MPGRAGRRRGAVGRAEEFLGVAGPPTAGPGATGTDNLVMVVYHAAPGSSSAEALALLGSLITPELPAVDPIRH